MISFESLFFQTHSFVEGLTLIKLMLAYRSRWRLYSRAPCCFWAGDESPEFTYIRKGNDLIVHVAEENVNKYFGAIDVDGRYYADTNDLW